jgi:CelD/BcsL family acetyltransferase involved in cellulose biosynthesis
MTMQLGADMKRRGQEMDGMVVKQLLTFEEISHLRQDWDSFMEATSSEIFLSYDWCRIWWKHYGKDRELRIFLFNHDSKIVAILPVFYERLRFGPVALRVIKLVGTDFTPITVTLPIHPDYLTEVVSLFLAEIGAKWQWDVLHVGPISGRYFHMQDLIETLRNALNRSCVLHYKSVGVQTYYEIADSFEKQIEGLSPRQRTKTRRVYKELREKNINLSSVNADTSSYITYLNEFISIHQTYWQSLGMPGHFGDWPSAQDLHKEFAASQIECGRLRLLKVMLNDKCAGYEYMYKFGDTYCWFLSARNDISEFPRVDFHRIAFGEKVKHAIEDRVKYIDAMRGYYEYKLVLGGQVHTVHSILIHRKKIISRLKYWSAKKIVISLNVVYMKIWRRRLVPMLRMPARPLMKFWIKTSFLS